MISAQWSTGSGAGELSSRGGPLDTCREKRRLPITTKVVRSDVRADERR
jgi:hypothetical protein